MSNVGNKVINIVKRLNDCILDSNNNVKSSISGEIKDFIELNPFEDTKDRLDFCVQFIEWLMNSDYLFNSTKEFLKQSNVGVKEYFESKNRAIIRYNASCENNSDKKELYVVNTCITRVQTDRRKLETILDNEFMFNLFENESNEWIKYHKNFLKECKKVSRLTIDKNAFAFDIDSSLVSTSITKPKFDSLLNIIGKYSTANMNKELSKLDNIQLGYLTYLCTVKPQKVKDKDNYDKLMKVIGGTYEDYIEEIEKEVNVSQEEYDRLLSMKKELEEKEEELNRLRLEIGEKDTKVNEETKLIITKIRDKMISILNGPMEDYEERFNKLIQYINSNIL